MNEREFKKLYDTAKEEMLKQAHAIKAANSLVKVSADRHILPLKGRDISIVYYPALNPDGSRIEEKRPLFIGFHGGGFVFGGCALDDAMWVNTSKALGVNIASIGYRMAPECMWRETLADSYESALYLKAHADEFGFDENHISLMGQSAGGTISATVAMKAKEEGKIKFDNQILIYPLLDAYTDPDSKGPGSLTGVGCYVMNDLHVKHEEANLPLVSPVFADIKMLSELPNAIIVVSENDNLRFEGYKYSDMLKKAGVNVSLLLCEGMPHGYFESGFKTPTRFEHQFLGDDAKELINSGNLSLWAHKTLDFIKENLKK